MKIRQSNLISPVIFFVLSLYLSGCGTTGMYISRYDPVNLDGDSLVLYLGHKDAYDSTKIKNDKLLILIQGSGRETVSKRFIWGIKAAELGYDILFLEKYAFNDKLKFDNSDCRERRVNDINFEIDFIKTKIYGNKLKEIVLFAESEGGEIAPEIACSNSLVKRMIIFGNGGLSGTEKIKILFDKEKQMNYSGYLTLSGIKTIEDLNKQLDDIKNNPTNDEYFLGHTYKYWNSYIYYDIDDFYDKLNIPSLIIIGERDMSVPCESVSHLKEKYKSKKNFSLHIIPDLDHQLVDSKGKKQFNKIMIDIVYPWFEKTSVK